MEFLANKLTGKYLASVLPGEKVDVDWVRAAIAYGNDAETLVKNCIENKRRLDIWMRYDHTVPVAPQLLRRLLANTSNNIFCKLVPDVLHSKIIWWKNYGIYVGSANLTYRAWFLNIEFGVFIPEMELEDNSSVSEIEFFFDELATCDEAFSLTEEIIQEQEQIQKIQSVKLAMLDEEAKKRRQIGVWNGPAYVGTPKAVEAHKARFLREWRDGLSILRTLANEAPNYRPKWLREDVPPEWQADQFLHAYYYNVVVDGNSHPFEEYYQENRGNPAKATQSAFTWWSRLDAPPSMEDHNCHVRAPVIRQLLSREHIANLSLEDFKRVCQANHSTVDHVRRVSLAILGLEQSPNASEDDRVAAFAEWLWKKRNGRSERVNELLRFVLDGGPPEDIPSRLFDAVNQPELSFSHLGTNQIAEFAGWARPGLCPPRNGRTSKALRALGYDVRVY